MAQTSREIVRRCLEFDSPERMPVDIWTLPWVYNNYPERIQEIQERFPDDFGGPGNVYRPSPLVKGDAFVVGEATDEWGCTFVNVQDGIHGEVHNPPIPDLSDLSGFHPPY